MARLDVLATGGGLSSNGINGSQSNKLIRVSASTWYFFFDDNGSADLYYIKSTNGGYTWTGATTVSGALSIEGLAVWFDGWTPGDAGTIIHVTYIDGSTGDVLYRQLQTSTDTLGGAITVFAGASSVAGANQCITIWKTVAGFIHVVFDIDGGTETGHYKSDALPVTTFTSKASPTEGVSDYFIGAPGAYADTNDSDLIFWDRSASEISIKVYDDSLDSWAETSIAASMTAVASTTVVPQFSVAIRPSDAHLILAAWSASDAANADLRVWDINGSGSITEQTNVILNSTDDQGCCQVAIDTATDDIYVFYLGVTGGAQTAYTSIGSYYKISTDGGATWGSETQLGSTTRSDRVLWGPMLFSGTDLVVGFIGTYTTISAVYVSVYVSAGSGGNANILRGSVVA